MMSKFVKFSLLIASVLIASVQRWTECLAQDVQITVDDRFNRTVCDCRPGLLLSRLRIPATLATATALTLNLVKCVGLNVTEFPIRLFENATDLSQLVISAPYVWKQFGFTKLREGTFDGLDNLELLSLEGFSWLRSVDATLFQPLRRLRSLSLVGFGQQHLLYAQLGAALKGLANSPLKELRLDGIHSTHHKEKVLDLYMLEIENVSLSSLVATHNDFNAVKGRPSHIKCLEHVRYLEVSANYLSYSAVNVGLDPLLFLNDLEELKYSQIGTRDLQGQLVHSYPPFIQKADAFEAFDDDIKAALRASNLTGIYLSCFISVVIPMSRSIRRISANNVTLFWPLILPGNICFEPSNNIEYVNLSGSPAPIILPPSIIGLRRIKYLDISRTNLRWLPVTIFESMSSLVVLMLANNPELGRSFAEDSAARLFRTLVNLQTLDLSHCGINRIPRQLFASLASLLRLDLSNNKLDSDVDLLLTNCWQLSSLDLSGNNIETLSRNITDQLDMIGSASGRLSNETLTIDLRGNPLSCLCNSTQFLRWMNDSYGVNVIDSQQMCLYPNGSQVRVQAINMTVLESSCTILQEFTNNSACPCTADQLDRLSRIPASLIAHVCLRSGDVPIKLTTALALSRNVSSPPWCPTDVPFYSTVRFIVPLSLACGLVVLLVVVSAVLYRRRKTEPVRRYIEVVMGLLRHHPGTSFSGAATDGHAPAADVDVLVYSHDDDFSWTYRVVLQLLSSSADLRVRTQLDFEVGSPIVEEFLWWMERSRVTLFVVSQLFVTDAFCRDAAMRAYTSQPQRVVVVVRGAALPLGQHDVLMRNLLRTNTPLYVAEDEPDVATVQQELRRTINDHLLQVPVDQHCHAIRVRQ